MILNYSSKNYPSSTVFTLLLSQGSIWHRLYLSALEYMFMCLFREEMSEVKKYIYKV